MIQSNSLFDIVRSVLVFILVALALLKFPSRTVHQQTFTSTCLEQKPFSLFFLAHLHSSNERGGIVVRAHASRAEGLGFEPDSML